MYWYTRPKGGHDRKHDRQLRLPDRYHRLYSQRQPRLLPDPLPAALFASMVQLLVYNGEKAARCTSSILPQLEKEYQFWMNGMEQVNAETRRQHVVSL